MAEEVEPGKEAGAQEEGKPVESAAAPEVSAQAEDRPSSWSWWLLLLAVAAVLLSVTGVFALARSNPSPLDLGFGLLVWGILDLSAQGRGLVAWKGPKAALGNVVNLVRGLALLGLGVWLCMVATGLARPVNPAVIVWTLVCLACFYLAAALALELLVTGLRLGGQAFLLAALVLMFFSYYYFSIPFTYSWAAVFAFLSFACATFALNRDALKENPFLSVAVLAALLILAAPLLTFTYQQSFVLEEQPLFTPTLLVPRMRQVLTKLSYETSQVLWAPVHTQAGQPGDVLFSDKVAFVDREGGRTYVKLFQQHENGLREELRVPVQAGVSLTAFSEDGSRLTFTDTPIKGHTPTLYVLDPISGRPAGTTLPEAAPVAATAAARIPFTFRHIVPWFKQFWLAWRSPAVEIHDARALAYRADALVADVAPGPGHGQVWRDLGRQLYYAAPLGGPRNPASAVWRYDFSTGGSDKLQPGRSMPAVSPDGRSLLSVGFVPKSRILEIADARAGDLGDLTPTDSRPFDAPREASYFPAWNAAQTEVLYMAGGRLMIMNSNGTHRRPFAPNELDSESWNTSKRVPFFLRWVETEDTYSIYRSHAGGAGQTLIYSVGASDISPPQWSDDGKRVTFIARRQGVSRVFTVGSDGSWPRYFFSTKDSLDELKWSPDSLRLAWICRRADGGPEEIWTAGYEGLDPVRVHTDNGHIAGLTWSPLGKDLAVQQTKPWTFLGLRIVKPDLRTVLMVDLVDDHARVMTRYGLLSWDPAFSPHGEAIAYFTESHPWSIAAVRKRSASLVVSQLY